MKAILIILIIIISMSCEKKVETDIGSTDFKVSVLDSTGLDLLNTSYSNSYNWDRL